MKNILVKIFGSRNQRVLKDFNKILKDVNSFEPEFKTLGDLSSNVIGLPREWIFSNYTDVFGMEYFLF